MISVWLQALALGIVQGLSEFIPVSSDGHLVLVPYLLGWEPPTLAFVVALHMGTLAAVLLYFRRELRAMVGAVTGRADSAEGRLYRRLALFLVLASLPVVVIGLLLKDRIETVFASPTATAALLFVTAALLLGGEKARDRRVAKTAATASTANPEPERASACGWVEGDTTTMTARRLGCLALGRDDRDPAGTTLADLGFRHAVVMGLMQPLALLPGVSRSGSTITGGLASGLTREAATRFSFLLSIPALVGASMLNLPDLATDSSYRGVEILIGVLAAFASGYLAVRWLVALVARDRLTGFAWYCAAVGVIGLVGSVLLGTPGGA